MNRKFPICSRNCPSVDLTTSVCSDPPGWKQLITCTLPMNERIPLMTSTFSDPDDDDVFEYLSKDDSQALIDVIYEVSV